MQKQGDKMKLFSKAPKTMRADRIGMLIWHIVLAVIAARIMTAGELTQTAFAITALLIIIGLDLRDRAQEIFQQNEHLLLTTQIKIDLSPFGGHQGIVTRKMDGENTSTLALEEQMKVDQ
jgi:hypothetical protein